ncbi:hypothetical protein [Clostridium polynesiense]|uniref:hypothetical protein n=1 Tax=Clostridium polynesiense TaxID=1325933 RepID=UPI00058AC854|nr:hypothetical protein [Clostridium polynesiense]
MSNSISEVFIRFIGQLLILFILPKISSFFSISALQAFAISFGISLLDLIVFLIKKSLKKDKA